MRQSVSVPARFTTRFQLLTLFADRLQSLTSGTKGWNWPGNRVRGWNIFVNRVGSESEKTRERQRQRERAREGGIECGREGWSSMGVEVRPVDNVSEIQAKKQITLYCYESKILVDVRLKLCIGLWIFLGSTKLYSVSKCKQKTRQVNTCIPIEEDLHLIFKGKTVKLLFSYMLQLIDVTNLFLGEY